MAEVVLHQVSKVFPGGVRAVDRVDLTIRDREFVVLVGPSGCGKSTTLRMVAGLEEVTEGTIRIGERVVNDVAPKDRDIAMVFQNYALYPNMTVYRNMAFGLMLRRKLAAWDHPLGWLISRRRYRQARDERRAIDARVRQAAQTLGIESLLSRRPKALSGGQRQRVAVGRAIVRDPKAFLFDEPLSNLDAKLRVEMRAELKKLHRRLQTTTIYVTHDQEEAMTLGDEVVVMKDGVIQQAAPPLDVYTHPVNRFVAGFVGVPPMNFITGRLENASGLWFRSAAANLKLADSMAAGLKSLAGAEIVLGVRPENIRPGSALDATLHVGVGVIEPLGERKDAYATLPDGHGLVCRFDSSIPLREGENVDMQIDMNRVHFFEPGETGRNVSLSLAPA
ncbi:MAG: Trehalose import ATP-binding protein SugC [Phycisphaerae bacterium]|nr:Trehalose import ATP-binding protein SugC [Phycisphaerae bacterium]